MRPSIRWPLIIVGLITLNMVVVAATIYFAINDPSAAVEPDYYQKAVDWDAAVRIREASSRLGWSATLDASGLPEVSVQLSGPDGRAVAEASIRLTAFADARAADRQSVVLKELEPGRYAAPIEVARAGLWHFQIEAKRGSDTFLWSGEQHLNVAPAGLSSAAGGRESGGAP